MVHVDVNEHERYVFYKETSILLALNASEPFS